MTPKVRRLFIVVIALQVVFLLGLVGYRESILTLGRTAVLQTVPVDPRDLFRGEYVVLRYEITTIGRDAADKRAQVNGIAGEIEEGDAVYTELWRTPTADNDDPFSVRNVFSKKPSDGSLFIKGRVTQRRGDTITVEYGIEQYFVPEGRGLEIERADEVKVRVSINRSGTAAIKELIVDGEVWRPQ